MYVVYIACICAGGINHLITQLCFINHLILSYLIILSVHLIILSVICRHLVLHLCHMYMLHVYHICCQLVCLSRPVDRISKGGGVLFGGKVDLKPKGVSFGEKVDLCTIPYHR